MLTMPCVRCAVRGKLAAPRMTQPKELTLMHALFLCQVFDIHEEDDHPGDISLLQELEIDINEIAR